MHFSKETRKYINKQLTHGISNYFTFSIKEIQQTAAKYQQLPISCIKCKFPKLTTHQQQCINCSNQYPLVKIQNQQVQNQEETKSINKANLLARIQLKEQQTVKQHPAKKILEEGLAHKINDNQVPKNYHYNQNLKEDKKITKAMILCVDLSGSMCISYPSKYQKVNKEFVSKILGQQNYQILSKLGEQKVISNYQTFQALLNEGETPRNIIQMFKSQASRDSHNTINANKNKNDPKNTKPSSQQEEISEHITRKQIVGAIITKYLEILKHREPETYFTLIYFNNNIEVPILDFNQKQMISGIQDRSFEELIELGEIFAEKISCKKAKDLVDDDLIKNYTFSDENGQTAMTPALAFSVGLAKKMGHSLNQILVVTDGLSNIGFGQTENQLQREETSKIYQHLALKFAKPSNCVINFMTFEDCLISYEILDQIVGITGGIAPCISFAEHGGKKIVTSQTISLMSFNIVEGFFTSTQRLCYDTKIVVSCSNSKIKLKLPLQLKPFIIKNQGNKILLGLGIKSPKYTFRVYFEYDDSSEEKMIENKQYQTSDNANKQSIETFQDKNTLFTVLCIFDRKKKHHKLLQSQKIQINKGSQEQTSREQAKILSKQIKQKLKVHEMFQEEMSEYNQIQEKLQRNNIVLKQMDSDLVAKFELKKQKIEDFNAKVDRLTKDQMSMKSRTYKTYKQRDEDQDSEDDGFS